MLCRATEALLEDARSIEEVSKKLLEVNEAFGHFGKAHFKYLAMLTGDIEEIATESRYFQEHCQRKDHFDSNIKRWINEVKSRSKAREGSPGQSSVLSLQVASSSSVFQTVLVLEQLSLYCVEWHGSFLLACSAPAWGSCVPPSLS